MSELERQLTEALKRLSAQYEREQRRHSGQVEALRQHVERQREESEALRDADRVAGRAGYTLGGVQPAEVRLVHVHRAGEDRGHVRERFPDAV